MLKPKPIISSAALVTLKATICAVIVVPMFAPMITPTDWDSDIRPAEMKPTTSTVVTDDDWITAVTKAPVIAPMNRFEVSLARIDFMRSPATAFSAVAICSMPNRNSARPPNSCMPITPQSITCCESPAANAGTMKKAQNRASARSVPVRASNKGLRWAMAYSVSELMAVGRGGHASRESSATGRAVTKK